MEKFFKIYWVFLKRLLKEFWLYVLILLAWAGDATLAHKIIVTIILILCFPLLAMLRARAEKSRKKKENKK